MNGLVDETALMPRDGALAEIRTAVAAYNAQRPKVVRDMRLQVSVFVGGFLLVLGLLAYIFWSEGNRDALPWVGLGGMLAGPFVWEFSVRPARRFQQDLRDRLLPAVFGFVDEVRYAHRATPGFMRSMPGDEFVRRADCVHGDMIAGVHEDLAFTLSEAELSVGGGKSREVTFQGIILHFVRETAFPGTLLAARRPNVVRRLVRELFGASSLTLVTSGNPAVDERHEFRTNRPDAATPIVQGALAKALDYLARAWPDGVARIALVNRDCYLLVPSKKDFFELPPVDTPLDFDLHVQPMIRDLVTLLATAHLVRKIG